MRKPKIQTDRMLFDSPILDEMDDNFLADQASLAVSGQINIGKKGNPVTIFIEDEETGEVLEVNHVKTALLVIEDSRRSTSGLVIGGSGEPAQTSGSVAVYRQNYS